MATINLPQASARLDAESKPEKNYALLVTTIGIGLALEKKGIYKMPANAYNHAFTVHLQSYAEEKHVADSAKRMLLKQSLTEMLLAFNQALSDGSIQLTDADAKSVDKWSHGVEKGDMTADMTTMPVDAKKEYFKCIGACPLTFILAFRDLPEAQEIAYEVKQRTAKNINRGSFAAQRAGKNADGWMLEDVLGDLVAAEEKKRAQSAAR